MKDTQCGRDAEPKEVVSPHIEPILPMLILWRSTPCLSNKWRSLECTWSPTASVFPWNTLSSLTYGFFEATLLQVKKAVLGCCQRMGNPSMHRGFNHIYSRLWKDMLSQNVLLIKLFHSQSTTHQAMRSSAQSLSHFILLQKCRSWVSMATSESTGVWTQNGVKSHEPFDHEVGQEPRNMGRIKEHAPVPTKTGKGSPKPTALPAGSLSLIHKVVGWWLPRSTLWMKPVLTKWTQCKPPWPSQKSMQMPWSTMTLAIFKTMCNAASLWKKPSGPFSIRSWMSFTGPTTNAAKPNWPAVKPNVSGEFGRTWVKSLTHGCVGRIFFWMAWRDVAIGFGFVKALGSGMLTCVRCQASRGAEPRQRPATGRHGMSWVWKYEKSLWEQVCTKHGKKQTTKTWEEPDNHKEQCFWTKPLAHTFLTNPFLWVFFFKVFGLLVVLVAGKSFRNQKPKKLEENQKNQKNQCLQRKSLAQTFLRMLWFFCFFWFFSRFLGFW